MNKKLITLSIAAISGLLTPLFAGGWTETFGYHNFTQGGKFIIKDPSGNAVGTAYTTPSLSFRFKTNNNIEPVFRASPPTIQAGCNGLNIKGMFVSIINLERLSEMLKNSGASLAWGILIGLIYSLPGVAATFRNLNQWAKMIQQLMQNACRSGIAIGQALSHKYGLDKYKGKDFALIKSPQEMVKCSDNNKACDKDIFDLKGLNFDSSTMSLSFDGDSDVTPSESLKAWFKTLLRAFYVPTYNGFIMSSIIAKMDATARTNIFKNIIKDVVSATSADKIFSVGLMCVSFDNAFSDSECKSSNLSSSDVNVYVLNSSKSDFTSSFSTDEQKYNALMQLWKLGLTSNFGYDMWVPPISAFETQSKISKSYKSNTGLESLSDDEKSKNDTFLEELINGDFGALAVSKLSASETKNPMNKIADTLTKMMYLGTNDTNYTKGIKLEETPLNEMKAPLFTVVGMQNPESSGEKMYYIIFSGTSAGNAPFLKLEDLKTDFAKGAYERSYKLFEDMIKNGISTTLDGTMNIFLVVPGITHKISLLQKIPASERQKYLNDLAKFNAYYSTKAFIDNVFNGGSNFKAYPPLYYSDGTSAPSPIQKYSGIPVAKQEYANTLDQYIVNNANILTFAKAIAHETLEDIMAKDTPSVEKLDAQFFKLEQDIRAKALEKVAK